MSSNSLIAIFSEIIAIDQRIRAELARALPKGMELSHFSVLNHLVTSNQERTPAQIARALHVSRGAMTNTLAKLEARGDIHIRPDWEDARQKYVIISDAGRLQRDMALKAVAPVFENTEELDADEMRKLLSMLRELRIGLSSTPTN